MSYYPSSSSSSFPIPLTVTIEQLCENPTEDWGAILVVSDRAHESTQAAQETMRTLSQIFTHNRSMTAKLNAARIWSVLLGGSYNGDFIQYSCSPEFMAVIGNTILQRMPGDILRDRLVDVVGAGTWNICRYDPQHPLAMLWRQVKAPNASDEGLRPVATPIYAEPNSGSHSLLPTPPPSNPSTPSQSQQAPRHHINLDQFRLPSVLPDPYARSSTSTNPRASLNAGTSADFASSFYTKSVSSGSASGPGQNGGPGGSPTGSSHQASYPSSSQPQSQSQSHPQTRGRQMSMMSQMSVGSLNSVSTSATTPGTSYTPLPQQSYASLPPPVSTPTPAPNSTTYGSVSIQNSAMVNLNQRMNSYDAHLYASPQQSPTTPPTPPNQNFQQSQQQQLRQSSVPPVTMQKFSITTGLSQGPMKVVLPYNPPQLPRLQQDTRGGYGPSSSSQNNGLSNSNSSASNPWGVVNTSVATSSAFIPQSFQSSLPSLFASLGSLQGSKLTLNMPVTDFTKQVLQIPKRQSGNVMSLSRWKDTGCVTHEFLVLQATSPDGVPMYIRLDRRPVKNTKKAIFLLSSATTASDSAIFAATESALVSTETSKLDSVVPFRIFPSLHDLGKLLTFFELEAPEYNLRKENCWFFCSVIQEILTVLFKGENFQGTLGHAELGRNVRENIFRRARGPDGIAPDVDQRQGLA